jgi:hypothetical protein
MTFIMTLIPRSDIEDGMYKIKQIVGHIIKQEGASGEALKEALPVLQDTIRREIVNCLRAKSHPRSY